MGTYIKSRRQCFDEPVFWGLRIASISQRRQRLRFIRLHEATQNPRFISA